MSDFLREFYTKKQYHDRRNQIKEQIIRDIGVRGWNNLLHLCNVNGLLYLIDEMLTHDPNFQVTNLPDNLYNLLGEEFLAPLIGLVECEYLLVRMFNTESMKKEIRTIIANNLNILGRGGIGKDSNLYKLYEEYTKLGGEIGVIKSKLIEVASVGVGYVAYIR